MTRDILASELPEDPYLSRSIAWAFPARLVERFGERLGQHELRREIVATQIGNDLVDLMGITLIDRLQQSTNASIAAIVRAYTVARDVFASTPATPLGDTLVVPAHATQVYELCPAAGVSPRPAGCDGG